MYLAPEILRQQNYAQTTAQMVGLGRTWYETVDVFRNLSGSRGMTRLQGGHLVPGLHAVHSDHRQGAPSLLVLLVLERLGKVGLSLSLAVSAHPMANKTNLPDIK